MKNQDVQCTLIAALLREGRSLKLRVTLQGITGLDDVDFTACERTGATDATDKLTSVLEDALEPLELKWGEEGQGGKLKRRTHNLVFLGG